MNKTPKILELMMKPETALIFDIDGVLVSYSYGEYTAHHVFDIKKEGDWSTVNVYTEDRCFPRLKDFIDRHGISNVFCLSQEPFGREEQKTDLMESYYHIPSDHCYYVKSQTEKLSAAMIILNRLGLSSTKVPPIVMIDDNSETLRMFDETGIFATAHVSIFLNYQI